MLLFTELKQDQLIIAEGLMGPETVFEEIDGRIIACGTLVDEQFQPDLFPQQDGFRSLSVRVVTLPHH